MNTTTFQNFAMALKQLRTSHGMTQDELAERSGVSVRSISDLERGISRFPHKDTVQLLAEALQLAPAEAEQLFARARAARATGAVSGTGLSGQAPGVPSGTPSESALPLIGREREIAAIHDLLADPDLRLLTLIGVAGVGKTRLAVASAGQAGDIFADGVRMIDLSSIQTARYVLPAIAQELGVREQPSRPLAEAVSDWLADRRMLLVLDNCEHVITARSDIALLIERCPHLTVLATSREKLDIASEHIFAVSPLATPDAQALSAGEQITDYPAVQLFLACVTAQNGDFSLTPVLTRTIARICAHLEGIPLAIELAAARVPALPPRAILARLVGSPRWALREMLHQRAAHLPARQQTLRDALAWSYQLLDAREQIVFRRMSVFASGWTLEAAEAICHASPSVTVDMHATLTSLANKSLIRSEEYPDGAIGYRMHFVMRAYGAELLAERKENQAVQRRFAEYYAALAEQLEQALTGATQAASLGRLVREYENIRAALQWAREQQAIATGLQLASALWWFWENRGFLTEGRDWLEGMLALWQRHPASAGEDLAARAYYGATVLAITQGDAENGALLGEACLAHMHAPNKRARVLLMLGNLAKLRGDAGQAQRLYSEGLAILRELDDTKGILVALNNLSTLAIERGDLAAAMALLEESLALKRTIGDRRGEAVSLMNQGEVLKAQQDYTRAQIITEAGLDIFKAFGDMQGIALAYNNLGEIAEASGDDAQAAIAYAMSLTHYRRMEDRPGTAMTLLHLGQVCARRQEVQATGYLQEGAALYGELSNVTSQIECMLTLASFELSVHHPQQALYELQRVAPLVRNGQTPAMDALRERYDALLQQVEAGGKSDI